MAYRLIKVQQIDEWEQRIQNLVFLFFLKGYEQNTEGRKVKRLKQISLLNMFINSDKDEVFLGEAKFLYRLASVQRTILMVKGLLHKNITVINVEICN